MISALAIGTVLSASLFLVLQANQPKARRVRVRTDEIRRLRR